MGNRRQVDIVKAQTIVMTVWNERQVVIVRVVKSQTTGRVGNQKQVDIALVTRAQTAVMTMGNQRQVAFVLVANTQTAVTTE